MTGALLLAVVFWPIRIDQMTADACGYWEKVRSHLEVEGWVTYVAEQEDGDQHIRVCNDPKVEGMNRRRCVVWEIIPAIPLPRPKVGQHVRGRGIYRFDAERPNHGWAELHPLISWEALQ